MFKKAAVLGATGGMGYALTEALCQKNIKTIAFARSEENLVKYKENWGSNADIFPGDAMNQADVEKAVSKADAVFHAINIPYQNWDPALSILLDHILDVCSKQNKPFIYVDNIYSYGLQSKPATETSAKNPHTKKGKLRQTLIEKIKNSGVPYIIAHFPDFYGPQTGNTLLQYTFEQIIDKNTVLFVGKTNIAREFIYIKDGAKALADLALKEGAYGEVWNIPGTGTITGEEIARIASRHLNKQVSFRPVHKWMIRAIGVFDPFMREYTEMMYLNETPVILDGSKYEQRIGALPKTTYEDGIKESLDHLLKTAERNAV
ncbi:SDR family NAD(P)-dependent oxidoreductase [Bacillus sp. ISL-47]|uniref:SDR family NAD(P)-dependent oxidoreductase n=1 Tax=Bacillus sp. ISL-47 TaxID=2819130 RepID=UPI001BE84A64|nr:SDR family NAD(P)-dependent oxidoreductase [Bacillus sp. ISL-47]MBT2688411.1 SDR family NAD(P)-dependent oxidoreductase [Bacillus sp. ISL-47]MBT2707273.1 SDR family NAD(P)-dependent oxidoreductase [Pseudomonas sp. ISL-84]